MSRKLISFALAMVMVLALVLTGCSGSNGTTTTAAATTTAAVDATTTAAPASTSTWDTGSIVVDPLGIDLNGATLQYICNIPLNDIRSQMWTKAGQYVSEVYNGTVTFTLCDGAEYTSKVKTTLAAGEAADVIFTSSVNGFNDLVAADAFLPLDDLIPENCPKAFAKVPVELYEAVKTNGKIYAIIPFKDLVENNSLLYDKSQTDAAGVDLTGWVRWSDNNENFYKLREWVDSTDPSRKDIPVSCAYDNWFREAVLEQVGSRQHCIGANYEGIETVAGYEPYKDLFVVFDCPEFVDFVKSLNQLVTDRIIPYDRANYDKDNVYRNSGKQIVFSSQGYLFAPDSITDYECTLAKQAISISYTGYTHGGLNAINSDTATPAEAAKLIEILSCDKYLGTLLRFGEEGKHWVLTENGQADTSMGKEAGVKYWYGMQLGDITNCVLPTDVTPEFGDALRELNASAIYSTNNGFTPDVARVEAECAAVSAVYDEYISNTNLISGMLTDEQTDAVYAEFITKLKANGIEKILNEYQSQLDAWHAARS